MTNPFDGEHLHCVLDEVIQTMDQRRDLTRIQAENIVIRALRAEVEIRHG